MTMIDEKQLLCLGMLKRTHNKDLPAFVFVQREGLFVPFRSERIAELMGEQIWVLRSDMQEEEDGNLTWQDLVGYTIDDADEGVIGTIAQIDESTINTLAILSDDRMMPLHEDFILSIDEEKHILHVQLPFRL